MILLFETLVSIGGIYIAALIIGLILELSTSGNAFKRFLFGYPLTIILYNSGAFIAWICTFVFDILFSFIRVIWSILSNDPSKYSGPYMNEDGMMDKVFIFWVIVANIFAIWTIYLAEKKVRHEKYVATLKEKENQKRVAMKQEKKLVQMNSIKPTQSIASKLSDDYNKFHQKFNIK